MTLDNVQCRARARTTRVGAATAATLALGLAVFSTYDYGQTNERAIIAQASAHRPAAQEPSIRPFKVQVSQAALDDLRRRIAATRWPDKETVADRSQGAQLAKLQALARYS